ncbi:MAG: hypothetical protein ACM3VW_04450 [Bacteroidota bacterium]
MAQLLAGVAKVNITPAIGFDNMCDFMILKPAQDVAGELMARALVLDDGRTKAAIVTADLLWFTGEIVEAVRGHVERLTGIPGTNVILNCSHTHASAEVTPSFGASAEYIRELGKKVAGAIYMADQAKEPVTVGHGKGECRIGMSRWLRTEEGCRWAPAPESPCDHEVGVLRFDRLDGSTLAVLFNFPAHPSMFNSPKFLQYSCEYPGFAAEEVEQQFPGAIGMMLMGAGGDIKIFKETDDGPKFVLGDENETRHYGRLLGTEATRVALQIATREVAELRMLSETVELPLVPPFEAEHYEQEAQAIRDAGVTPAETYRLEWAERSAEIVRSGTAPSSVPNEVQLLLIGDEIALFATPGELFNQVGSRIKEALGVPGAFMAAYCNDTPHVGYLPSRLVESWNWCQSDHQLKYFTRPVLPSNFSGEVEDILVAAARKMMER